MKLRYKINLGLLVNLIILSTSLLTLFFFWSKYELENKLLTNFHNQTLQVSTELNSLFSSRTNEIENIAYQINSSALNFKKTEEILFNARDNFKAYQSIGFYDHNGIKRVDTNRIDINKSILSKNEFLDSDNYFLIQNDFETNTKVVSFYRKVYTKKNKLLGYIKANIPFSSLTNIVKQNTNYNDENEYNIVLYNESGETLYSSNPFKITKFLKVEHKTSNNKNFDFISNDKSFIAVYTINSADNNMINNWYIIVDQSKTIAYGKIYNNLFILLTCSLYIIFIVGLAYFNLAHSIFKPIENLNMAIKKAEKGHFDALNSLKISDDEIGTLILSTKEMTQKIDNLVHEQAIRNRMSVIGKMASGIAHEINNPLHLINNHSNIIYKVLSKNNFHLECDIDRARVTKSIRVINQTVHRISDVVSGLKSISKEHDLEPAVEMPINSLFDRIYILCKEKLSNFEIQFDIQSTATNKTIFCRPGQLQHAILNLINNSIDAIKDLDEKWIKIQVEVNQVLEIRVINSGPKIEKEIAKNLFNPLFTTKINSNGIGLGLSISKQIVTNLNGKIYYDFDSTFTTFIIKVPLVQEQEDLEDNETLKVA